MEMDLSILGNLSNEENLLCPFVVTIYRVIKFFCMENLQ